MHKICIDLLYIYVIIFLQKGINMNKVTVKIYTNLDQKEETYEMLAIKDNNIIKYNDFANNKMMIDLDNNVLTRENEDFCFTLDFLKNSIVIVLKKVNKVFNKEIKTLMIERKSNAYNVKYCLVDEGSINEYYIKF